MSSDDEYVDDDLFGEPAAGPSHNNAAAAHEPPAPRPRRTGQRSGNAFLDFDEDDDDGLAGGRGAGFGFGGMFPNFLGGRGGRGGYGGHPMMHPPASAFKKNYNAFSTAILEMQQGRGERTGGRSNVMHGGKIIMPQEALIELTNLEMESPYMFEVKNLDPNKRDLVTHCGVLEFIAAPGTVHLPQWMMSALQLEEGDPIRLTGVRLPKGKFAKVQAQSSLFLELGDHKAVLEQALSHFSCLTKGDMISIYHNMMTFDILIMELQPSDAPGVSIIDTDLSVDFAAPKDYVEPAPVPRAPPPTMASKMKIDTLGTQSVDARGSGTSTPTPSHGDPSSTSAPGQTPDSVAFEAFRGGGKTMGGKTVKGKGTSKKKIEEVDPESKIIRTDKQRIVTADTQIGERKVPAKLELPYGTLFFGYNTRPFRPIDPNAPVPATEPAGPFASVQGDGNTLSGRSRPRPPANADGHSEPPAAASAQPAGAFGGQGHSLLGSSSSGAAGSGGAGLKLGSKKKSGKALDDAIVLD